MVILGIDPGTAATGYGLVSVKNFRNIKPLDYGQIRTSKDLLMSERLLKIYNSSIALIEKHSPDVVIIEQLFFNTNAKTAISVGQARGIHILTAGRYKLPVFEYTALEAKKIITGHGRADKDIVRTEIQKILGLKTQIKPIDASDALAMAVCHCIKMQSR